MRPVYRSKWPVVLSVLFSLVVIAYVFYQLDWRVVRLTFAGLNWGWVVLAFVVYILNYILRTLRLQIILPLENAPFFQLLGLTGLYGMYNYLLPVGSGEITLVALLNYRLKIPVVDGLASLIATRYLDFSTIALMLPAVLIVNWKILPPWIVYTSLVFCALVLMVNLYLVYFFQKDPMFSLGIFHLQVLWIARLKEFLIRLRDGLVRVYQKKKHFHLLFLTLAVWICVYTNYYLVVISLGYQITYFQIVVVSIIMIPMTLLPIQGLANFGTHEIGWVIAFSIFGQQKDIALSIAFSSHILLLFFVLLLGACSYLIGFMTNTSVALQE